ncbi:MAG: hypothetical protein KKF44_04925 [Nanoarchaeota archaeon]|nr:hypothetical protein [Nanoarchaeota archaeon]
MSDLNKIKTLEKVGLTRNEAIIYIELLKEGGGTAKDITRKTNMHRTTVYGCFQRLEKKGLASEISKEGVTFFRPAHPLKLHSLLQERERQLKDILPDLLNMENSVKKTKHEVEYFKGRQGLKTIFEDIIVSGENYVAYGPSEEIESNLKAYFHHFREARQKKNIHIRLIYSEEAYGKQYTKTPLSEIRYLPNEYFASASHRVYGDKVAIIIADTDDPIGILIHNKEVAKSFRKHFNLLWKIAKKKR